MASQWHYSKSGTQLGPVSSERLKELAASGDLLPGDLVWKEGLPDWRPASTLKGLFPEGVAGSASPPPLPIADPDHRSSLPTGGSGASSIATPPGEPPARSQPDFFDRARDLTQKAKLKAEAFQREAQAKAERMQREAQDKYAKTMAQAKDRFGQPTATGAASSAGPGTPTLPAQGEGPITPPRLPSMLDVGRAMADKAKGRLGQLPTRGSVFSAASPAEKGATSGHRVAGLVGAGVLFTLFLVCGLFGSLFKSGEQLQSKVGPNSATSPGAGPSSLSVDTQKEIYLTYCKRVSMPSMAAIPLQNAQQGLSREESIKKTAEFGISGGNEIARKYRITTSEVLDIFQRGEREGWFDKKKWPKGLSWDSL